MTSLEKHPRSPRHRRREPKEPSRSRYLWQSARPGSAQRDLPWRSAHVTRDPDGPQKVSCVCWCRKPHLNCWFRSIIHQLVMKILAGWWYAISNRCLNLPELKEKTWRNSLASWCGLHNCFHICAFGCIISTKICMLFQLQYTNPSDKWWSE